MALLVVGLVVAVFGVYFASVERANLYQTTTSTTLDATGCFSKPVNDSLPGSTISYCWPGMPQGSIISWHGSITTVSYPNGTPVACSNQTSSKPGCLGTVGIP